MAKSGSRLAGVLRKNWFVIGILVCIVFAHTAPWIGAKDGPLIPAITVKVFGVSFIFFSSGLTLKSEELKRSFMQVRVHAFVQLYTLVAIPIMVSQLVKVLGASTTLHPMLLKGLMIVGCMPPPVSSATILARAAGGNEGACIFNSAFGSFIGIFVTPFLLLNAIGISTVVPARHIVVSLGSTVVLPLIGGQLVRHNFWHRIEKYNIPFSTLSSIVLLLIIYTAFCDTFSSSFDVSQSDLIGILVADVGCITVFTLIAFVAALRLGYRKMDVVCIMFSATHKSLTLGMPMIKIIFEGNPQISQISLPLLFYHPMQIMLGSLVVPTLRDWLQRSEGHLPTRRASSRSLHNLEKRALAGLGAGEGGRPDPLPPADPSRIGPSAAHSPQSPYAGSSFAYVLPSPTSPTGRGSAWS